MPDFQYKAKDRNGISHVGSLAAPSRNAAVNLLKDRNWIVLNLESSAQKKSRSLPIGTIQFAHWFPPRSIHVELSLQQLALMNRSGMTLVASINSIIEQTSSVSLAKIWEEVVKDIGRGQSLAVAMSKHKCFPEFVIRLVKVGERTGDLETVLTRASDTLKNRRKTREAFASATIYPILIIGFAIMVTIYMMVYLIPRLQAYLDTLGKDMPAMTQSLIDASFWLRGNYTAIVLIGLAFVCGGLIAYSAKEGRLLIDNLLLKVPLLGKLIRLAETSKFARSLSMMLKSGITLTEGLGAVEKIVGNRFLRQAVSTSREKIIRGGNLVDSLSQKGAFTDMLGQMAAVGQQTGELGLVLDEVSTLHEAQFDSTVKRIKAILTPTMTIVIGGLVGYIYIAFFLALVAAGS